MMHESPHVNRNNHIVDSIRYQETLQAHPDISETLTNVQQKRLQSSASHEAGKFNSDNRDSTIGGYIGGGQEKSVFAIDNLALKVVHDRLPSNAYGFDQQLAPLERAEGIPHLEQLVAHDKDTNVLITKLMNGQPIATIPSWELARAIQPHHIEQLTTTLQDMKGAGLHYDNIGNVLFDKKEGFNFVDCQFLYYNGATPESAAPDAFTLHDIEQLDVANFLNAVTTRKSVEVIGLLTEQGETERIFKSRSLLGRLAVQRATRRNL